MEGLWVGEGEGEVRYTRGVGASTTARHGDADGLGAGIGLGIGVEERGENRMGDGYEDSDVDECERGDVEKRWLYEIESQTRYYSVLQDEV